ncbi:MspA family porin [Gordonia soli]|uniref:MspA family protein n=1 Tax=Gordonia soli NBRC 108243 TaxID=1223545 RepID=M0QQS7_9ACTN|nr:MspA family porin [Gordonia soli]GAC70918.1 hypothetical protein GS4_43_00450 [Gordonia soli NBRC 108243]
MKKIFTRRVAAAAGLAGAAVMGLTALGAGGAVAGPLPGGYVVKTLVDGTPVQVRLYDEFANIQKAVTNIQTSREVWTSGKIRVTVGGEAEGAAIKAGYLVGCQVDFGASAKGSGGVTGLAPDPNGGVYGTPEAGAGGGFTLAPGQAKYVPVIQTTSGDSTAYKSYKVTGYTFKGRTGGVTYSQEKFGVDGCAGYAQAKARVQVAVKTDAVTGVITLYGKPFSIG